MKKLFALTVAFAALVAVGCAENKSSTPANGTGTESTPADPAADPAATDPAADPAAPATP